MSFKVRALRSCHAALASRSLVGIAEKVAPEDSIARDRWLARRAVRDSALRVDAKIGPVERLLARVGRSLCDPFGTQRLDRFARLPVSVGGVAEHLFELLARTLLRLGDQSRGPLAIVHMAPAHVGHQDDAALGLRDDAVRRCRAPDPRAAPLFRLLLDVLGHELGQQTLGPAEGLRRRGVLRIAPESPRCEGERDARIGHHLANHGPSPRGAPAQRGSAAACSSRRASRPGPSPVPPSSADRTRCGR